MTVLNIFGGNRERRFLRCLSLYPFPLHNMVNNCFAHLVFVVAPTTISREGGVGLVGETTRTWLVLIEAKWYREVLEKPRSLKLKDSACVM